MKKILLVLLFSFLFFCCKNDKKVPVYLDSGDVVDYYDESEEVIVPFRSVGGVKYVKVSVNGFGFEIIFDTGCSNALISVAEANYLYQKGKLTADDILGISHSMIADGSIVENMMVNLRDVVIDDQIHCSNVLATVSKNIDAPLLLGNEVLDRVATITIDNENEVLVFKLK